MLTNAIRSGRRQLVATLLAVLLPVLLGVGVVSSACGSDDGTGPVRPVRLPPTTISEGEPPPRIQDPPRPVEPLPPPEAGQP